jgi:hypothetical protein
MSIATRILPDDRSLQSEITRYLLPYKMERVIGEPHVLTPSGDTVRSRGGLEHRVPCLRGVADVRFVVEQTQLRRASELQATQQDGGKDCAMPEPEKAGLIWSRRSSRGAHGFGLTRRTGLHTQFCEASRHGGYSLWRERGAEQFLAIVDIHTAPRVCGMTPCNSPATAIKWSGRLPGSVRVFLSRAMRCPGAVSSMSGNRPAERSRSRPAVRQG